MFITLRKTTKLTVKQTLLVGEPKRLGTIHFRKAVHQMI